MIRMILMLAPVLAPGVAVAQQQPQAAYESPAATMPISSNSEEAIVHFWAAVDELDNIYPLRATEHARLALELDPSLGMARVIHGFVKPGLVQQARLEEIARGLALIADRGTAAEMVLALAYKEWISGNQAEARTLFGAVMELAPQHPHPAFRWALLTGIVDGQSEGIVALKKVTSMFPQSAPAYNNLAYGLWATGSRQGAVHTVRKYLELKPDHPNPHDSYAELMQWAGRYDEAARQYRIAIELDPAFDQAYLGLAEIAQLTGKPDEAQRYMRTAIEYAPSDQARINYTRALGNAYLLGGDWKAAMEHFGKAAAEAKEAGFNGIAIVSYRQMALVDAMGDGSALESHLAKAEEIQGNPTNATYGFAGLAYALAGDTQKARAEAAKLEESASGNFFVSLSHTLSALLDLEGGDVGSALEELEEANPTDPLVRALFAEAYGEMGEAVEARAFREQVLNDPTFSFLQPIYPVAYLRAEGL